MNTSHIKLTGKLKALPHRPELVTKVIAREKTNTRRLINPQPTSFHKLVNGKPMPNGKGEFLAVIDGIAQSIKPRYQPGDLLYLTEKHWIVDYWTIVEEDWIDQGLVKCEVKYADGNILEHKFSVRTGEKIHNYARWRPARFMFRDFARAVVLVEDVRPERVRDITEEDAIAEGVELITDEYGSGYKNYRKITSKDAPWVTYQPYETCARHSFGSLWNSIHQDNKTNWDVGNPWVWRIQYRLVWSGHSLHLHLPELIDSLKREVAV